MRSPYSVRSSRGHVRPQKQTFQLPRWILFPLGIVALIALSLIIRSLINNADDGEGDLTHNQNRLWIDRTWTAATPPDEAAWNELIKRINDHQITMVYVQAGVWRRTETEFIYIAQPNARVFRERMQSALPDVQVAAWVWVGPAAVLDTPDYNRSDVQAQIIQFATEAIATFGYDGIHLQAYAVEDGNENYVRLVQALDAALGDNKLLSIAVPPDNQPTDPAVPSSTARRTPSWSPRYKERLAFWVDEMAIMAHASGFEAEAVFETWMAYQLESYAKLIESSGFDTDLIAVIPTYPAEDDPLHYRKVENVTTAINATREGIRRSGKAARYIVGTGIYIYGEAMPDDWALYYALWIAPS